MQRTTSALAYIDLLRSGGLSASRARILLAIEARGGAGTSGEIERALGSRLQHTRLTELRSMGLVVERGTRECSVTRKTAIVWAVTRSSSYVPAPSRASQPPSPRSAFIKASLDFVEAVIAAEASGRSGVPREPFEALRASYLALKEKPIDGAGVSTATGDRP